jgi:endonuclease YncB( thermonuclease family)
VAGGSWSSNRSRRFHLRRLSVLAASCRPKAPKARTARKPPSAWRRGRPRTWPSGGTGLAVVAAAIIAITVTRHYTDAASSRTDPGSGAAMTSCVQPHVADGDTITCGGVRVRIFGINAPELNHPDLGIAEEPGGQAASDRMFQLTRTRVECVAAGDQFDRYGRMVARCSTSDTPDLGAQLLREGLACQWVRYSHHTYDGVGRDCDGRGK